MAHWRVCAGHREAALVLLLGFHMATGAPRSPSHAPGWRLGRACARWGPCSGQLEHCASPSRAFGAEQDAGVRQELDVRLRGGARRGRDAGSLGFPPHRHRAIVQNRPREVLRGLSSSRPPSGSARVSNAIPAAPKKRRAQRLRSQAPRPQPVRVHGMPAVFEQPRDLLDVVGSPSPSPGRRPHGDHRNMYVGRALAQAHLFSRVPRRRGGDCGSALPRAPPMPPDRPAPCAVAWACAQRFLAKRGRRSAPEGPLPRARHGLRQSCVGHTSRAVSDTFGVPRDTSRVDSGDWAGPRQRRAQTSCVAPAPSCTEAWRGRGGTEGISEGIGVRSVVRELFGEGRITILSVDASSCQVMLLRKAP